MRAVRAAAPSLRARPRADFTQTGSPGIPRHRGRALHPLPRQAGAALQFPRERASLLVLPEFREGGVLCEGNFYEGVPVNIDAAAQLVLVRLSSGQQTVALAPAQVDTLLVGDRCFVGRPQADRELPAGFYEVIGQGPEQVYKRVDKRLHSSVNNVNGTIIGYTDENYDTSLTRHFAIATTYYFRDRDGHFSRIKGKSALLRRFPEQKREIRAAVREAGLDGRNTDFDAYCLGVLNAAAR